METLPQPARVRPAAIRKNHRNNDVLFIFSPFACLLHYYGYILLLYRKQGKKYNTVINRQMKKIWQILAIIGWCCSAAVQAAEKGVNIYDTARSVPSKVVYGEAGNRVRMDDFKGDFVLAVFWSRYCVPCIRELESLNEYAKRTKNDGIRVILISPKEEWQGGFAEQRRFLNKHDAEALEIYVDNKSDLAAAFGIFSSPVTVLISRDGQEIGRIRGSADWDSDDVIQYIYRIKAEHG